jgi:hypothetical protein
VFTIGIIAAQPGWPALEKIFQSAAIIKIANASEKTQNIGPGACPWAEWEYEYSTCASKRAGLSKTVRVISMSKFIGVKS